MIPRDSEHRWSMTNAFTTSVTELLPVSAPKTAAPSSKAGCQHQVRLVDAVVRLVDAEVTAVQDRAVPVAKEDKVDSTPKVARVVDQAPRAVDQADRAADSTAVAADRVDLVVVAEVDGAVEADSVLKTTHRP